MFQDKDFESLKLVLIGESGVGKTSIISQFIDQVFQNDIQSTIGGTFSTKIVKCGNGKILKLELWDTAGQERYRSISQLFYKDANAVILVYDITNKFSFEEIQNYWFKQVKESATENIILSIVGNKLDLYEQEVVDQKAAKKYAEDNNALFAVTSAKNSSGIEDLFIEIVKKFSGADSASIIQDNNDMENYPKFRKDTLKITTEQTSKTKKKKCC